MRNARVSTPDSVVAGGITNRVKSLVYKKS